METDHNIGRRPEEEKLATGRTGAHCGAMNNDAFRGQISSEK